MDAYADEHGYMNDITGQHLHHKIYLSDAKKVAHPLPPMGYAPNFV
jgi:hypothetical protein